MSGNQDDYSWKNVKWKKENDSKTFFLVFEFEKDEKKSCEKETN